MFPRWAAGPVEVIEPLSTLMVRCLLPWDKRIDSRALMAELEGIYEVAKVLLAGTELERRPSQEAAEAREEIRMRTAVHMDVGADAVDVGSSETVTHPEFEGSVVRRARAQPGLSSDSQPPMWSPSDSSGEALQCQA